MKSGFEKSSEKIKEGRGGRGGPDQICVRVPLKTNRHRLAVDAPEPSSHHALRESVPPIGGIAVGRYRNRNVVVPIAFDFKHNFHKRIDGVEFLIPEIIPCFKFQFVNPAVGLSGWKKMADSTVAVRYTFRDTRPCDAVGTQTEEMDRHTLGRDSPVDIQNVRAQLILLG